MQNSRGAFPSARVHEKSPRTLNLSFFFNNPTTRTHCVCFHPSLCEHFPYAHQLYKQNVEETEPPLFPPFYHHFGDIFDQQPRFGPCSGFGPCCDERREEARRLHRVRRDLSRSDHRWDQRLVSSSLLQVGAQFTASSGCLAC